MAETFPERASAPSPVRRAKLSDQIYDSIYQRIATGQYAVGSRLPNEMELSRQYGTSRPVIREALAELREDGVIATRERIGNFVIGAADETRLRFVPLGNLTDVQKFFAFRVSLEGEAAFQAALHRTADDIAAMEAAERELETLVEAAEPSVDADYAFHVAVVAGSHNRFFVATVKSLINHVRTGMSLCRRLSFVQPELHLDQMKEEHRAVVAAVAKGDAPAARAAMRFHIDTSRQRVFEGQHLLSS